MADAFETTYSRLRADILARHFSLSCYARADLFDMEANLGIRTAAADSDSNASPGGIAWALPTVNGSPGAASLYSDAADLEAKLRDNRVSPDELWRWTKHDRTNALLMTGVRLIPLAVEAKLGGMESLDVIGRVLHTLRTLLRFDRGGDSPWRGYIVRWDPIASDLWETRPGPAGTSVPVQNYEFLLNGDKKVFDTGDHYLYCTPLTDPRYLSAIAMHGDLQRGRDRYRRWEPSMDEYVGLTVGLYMIWFCLRDRRDRKARAAVADASYIADLVGRYLRHTGYFLVRPCGGFTFRGAFDITPCQEFPIARALAAITGNNPLTYIADQTATFERALRLAGYGRAYDEAGAPDPTMRDGEITNFLSELMKGAAAKAPELVDRTIKMAAQIATSSPASAMALLALGTGTGRAATVAEQIDISGKGIEKRGMVALCQVLNWIARNHPLNQQSRDHGPRAVFDLWMMSPRSDSPADGFRTLLGLTSLHDPSADNPVAMAFRAHFDTEVKPLPRRGREEVETGVPPGTWVTAWAVRLLLRRPNDNLSEMQRHLDQEITDLHKALNQVSAGRPALVTMNRERDTQAPGTPLGTVAERYDAKATYMGYSVPLALAWLWERSPGGTSFPSFAAPSVASIATWPTPSVPDSVVTAARAGKLAVPVDTAIMRRALLTGVGAHPLLKDPPPRPRNLGAPPPPVGEQTFEMPAGATLTFFSLAGLDLTQRRRELRFRPPAPTPPVSSIGYQLVVVEQTAVTAVRVDEWTARVEGGVVIVTVYFSRNSFPPTGLRIGRFQARLKTAWVRVLD